MTSVQRSMLKLLSKETSTQYCPTHFKSNCNKPFVRPILKHASPTWVPHLQTDISALERTTARCVLNDYSWRSSIIATLNSLIGLLLNPVVFTLS